MVFAPLDQALFAARRLNVCELPVLSGSARLACALTSAGPDGGLGASSMVTRRVHGDAAQAGIRW
jgi:hypothetical protein